MEGVRAWGVAALADVGADDRRDGLHVLIHEVLIPAHLVKSCRQGELKCCGDSAGRAALNQGCPTLLLEIYCAVRSIN